MGFVDGAVDYGSDGYDYCGISEIGNWRRGRSYAVLGNHGSSDGRVRYS